jgi:putative flippase GtrA
VELLGAWYVAGNAIGMAAGGLTNFYLNRNFVFNDGQKTRSVQLMRYTMVWAGYLSLASGGIFLFTHYFGLNYLISKVVVSLGLAFGYNYPLQKRFVFR